MTMSSSVSKVTLLGDGVQTSWPFAFKVWKAADLEIAITNQDGVTTVVSNWSVALVSVGGTVTYPSAGAPLPLGHKITIKRSMDFLQDVDLVSGTRWDPEVVETALDQATAERQELKERLDRSIAVDIASGESPDALLASIYEAKDTAVDNAAAALDYAERAEIAATTIIYYNHEGTILSGQNTITLPWAYDTNVGVEVYLGGVKQAESSLVFVDPYTVQLVDPVTDDTEFEAVASARAQTEFADMLAASGGSALVGFLQDGTGASARTVQAKLRDAVALEDFGASTTSSASENAAAFIAALATGKRICPPQQAYSFQFDGSPISYSGSVLDIDLGPFKHTFLNFGGIVGDNVGVLRYNGRFSASDGYCKGLGRFRNLQLVDIGTFEITDVYCDSPTSDKQFFGLEYSSNLFDDNQLTITVNTCIFKNLITKTVTSAEGATPMTGFGNYGGGSSQSQRHSLYFNNLVVEEFYSVGSDGTTIIDGDSDFFRLFSNPTNLTINTLSTKNVGKRFIKSQEHVYCTVINVTASLDSRFSGTNFIGYFEGQVANSGIPSRFRVCKADFDFSLTSTISPLFFNASGLPHEMVVDDLTYKNIGVYSASENILFHARTIRGSGLRINASSSDRIYVENISDSGFRTCGALQCVFENFNITLLTLTGSFPIINAILRNGVFNNLDISTRIATVKEISNVSIKYTTGTIATRPMRPVTSGIIRVDGLTVEAIGPTTQTFEGPGGGGTMIIRDYRSTNQTLAFFSTGTWNFVLDNCDNDTVTGAGAVSIVRATYV
jgi:hypothetical protein